LLSYFVFKGRRQDILSCPFRQTNKSKKTP